MTENSPGIRIASVLGTSRPGNFTGKALALVEDELRRRGAQVETLDSARMQLSFPGDPATADAQRLKEVIERSSGVVVSTPEYHGSFCSSLKLMIENMGFPSVLSGKPVALLGVAAGRIGAIKSLEQLRSVCSHVGAIVLPGPVSVAQVHRVFDSDGNCTDEAVEKQVRGLATSIMDYLDRHVCPRYTLEAMVRGSAE